jgi:hypothetical protein
MLGIGVGVAVGLAPLLGKARVPGFAALLDLYPESLQATAIPIASLLMGIVAAFVQFYFRPGKQKHLGGWFAATGAIAVAALLSLTQIYAESVTTVTYEGGRLRVPYVTGFGERPQSCSKCPPGVSNEECIHGLATPDLVASCFGESRIRHAREALLYSYLGAMLSFGALIGFLILKN